MGKPLILLLQLTVYLDVMLCTSGCVIGDVPDVLGTNMNQSDIVSGFYLNLNSSAQCSGEIVSWIGCYYLEEGSADTSNGYIELDVGVWRPTMDGFQLIGNLSKLAIPPVNPSYTFICQTWDLSCEDRLSVQQGDVIGVYISSTETRFKVLGSVEGGSVYRKEGQRGDSNILNQFNPVAGYSLYIEATIEQGLGSGRMDPLCPSVNSTEQTPIPTSTLDPTGSTQSTDVSLPLWAVYVIAVMGSIILVLVVVFVLVLCARSRLCVTAKRREEWTDVPGEHLPKISEDNIIPYLHLKELDTGTHKLEATPPKEMPQYATGVLSAELQIVVTEAQDFSGSKVGSSLQRNGATSEVQRATPPMAKPRNASLVPGSGNAGSVPHASPPMAKPRRGVLPSTASDCSEAGSVQLATPPAVKQRRDIPIPKPRADLNMKATPTDSLVVDRKKIMRKSKSECELLCPILNVDSEAQRYSELTGSTDSYPYVIRSCEMQYSRSLPDLRMVPLLPPRGASVPSGHGSSESLYAIPDQICEAQPYLEFQPIYSYAYAKVPLKYRTINASNWSSWKKGLPSPRHKLTDGGDGGKRLVTSQGQRSDCDQLNPLSIKLRRDRNTNVHRQASAELASPDYAEIDSPLEGEVTLSFNPFSTSPPVGGTTYTGPSAEKQDVSSHRSNSPCRIQETTQSNTRERSPKPGKFTGLHNGLDSSHPSAGYQVATDCRTILESSIESTSSAGYVNNDEYMARNSSNSPHYMKLNETTTNRKSMPYTRPHKVSSSVSASPNGNSLTDPPNKSLHRVSPQVSRKKGHEQLHVPEKHNTSTSSDDNVYDHLS